jgi:outer membrane usher protein FimD/PapC
MKRLALFLMAMATIVAPVLAHHSAAAEYDIKSTVTLKGAITNIEWLNPHARFYVDVKDADGKVTNWEIETGSPNQLLRGGWTRNTLKVGDVITVEAYRAKDGANLADAVSVTTAEGRKLIGGTSTGDK